MKILGGDYRGNELRQIHFTFLLSLFLFVFLVATFVTWCHDERVSTFSLSNNPRSIVAVGCVKQGECVSSPKCVI